MNPLMARFANEPALLAAGSESRFEALLNAAAEHPAFAEIETAERAGDDFWTELPERMGKILRPYVVDTNGVLCIPVRGVLLNNFPYQFLDYATGYEYLSEALRRGIGDSNVRGIALVIDSPGGMVAGCFDLVDEIYDARSAKPIRAYAAEHAYSAAYAIFSGASHGTVARTGGVGSIGVVTTHVDVSKMMNDDGVKVTFIYAGKHKVDGNAYEALPPDVQARIQARIDDLYAIFVSSVARNRGLEEQAVRDTEALTYGATDALSTGLADEVGKLDDALAAFAASLDDQSDNSGEDAMADEATTSAVDQAAAIDAAREEGRTSGLAEGAAAERIRVAAILGSDEAKGRETLANHLALGTDTAADAAVAILGKSNKAEAEGTETPFNQSMSSGNPDVGSQMSGSNDPDEVDTIALARGAGLSCIRRQAAIN